MAAANLRLWEHNRGKVLWFGEPSMNMRVEVESWKDKGWYRDYLHLERWGKVEEKRKRRNDQWIKLKEERKEPSEKQADHQNKVFPSTALVAAKEKKKSWEIRTEKKVTGFGDERTVLSDIWECQSDKGRFCLQGVRESVSDEAVERAKANCSLEVWQWRKRSDGTVVCGEQQKEDGGFIRKEKGPY